MHHHERRDAAGAGELGDRRLQVRRNLDCVAGAAVPGDGGPRPVRRQVQLIRQPRKGPLPVRDLRRHRRFRIVLRAEDFALPQRVVGVLHHERRPCGQRARRAGGIRGHHVARQRTHRESVGSDVVHDEHQHVLGGRDREQTHPDRDIGGEVEPGDHHSLDERRQVGLRDRLGGDRARNLGGRANRLVADTVDVGEHRAQRFVPFQHVTDCGRERFDVEVTRQPDRQRDVVHRRFRFEPVQEPHPLLRERQRDPVRARRGHEGLRPRTGGRRHPCSEGLDGGGVEQDADRDRGVERRAEAGAYLCRQQRVAAEREEVVVAAHPVDVEDVGEDRGDGFLDRSARGPEFPRLELGFGQCLAVQLAAAGQGQAVENHEHRRHHVRREGPGRELLQFVHLDRPVRGRDHVRDELVTQHDDGGLGHRVVPGENGFDLTELDAEAAQLHLVVGAADVFEHPVRGGAHDVTGPVQARAGQAERVGDEPFRRERGTAEVAAGDSGTGEVQLSGDAGRDGPQAAVEDVRGGAADGPTDRDGLAGDEGVGDVGRDGGLGGTVRVEHPAARRPSCDEFGRAGLAADDHGAQGLEARRVHRGQRGRRDERVRDVLRAQEVGQLVTAVDRGRGDHHRRARTEGHQQFEDRRIEARRCEMQCPRIGIDAVPLHLLGRERGQAGVRDHDALRHTRGSGRVDDVRGVGDAQRCGAVRVAHRSIRLRGHFVRRRGVVEHEPRHRGAQGALVFGAGDAEERPGIGDHVRDAVGRIVRVHRHEGRAALRDGPHGHDRLDRASERHRDHRFRAGAARDQCARQS